MTTVRQVETVLIPAGPFTMGDDNGRPDERPAHRVTLSAFRLAVLPVTNEDYAAFLAATAHEAPRFWDDPAFNRPRQPVVGVSWFDAVAYCEWLSGSPGRDVPAADRGGVGEGRARRDRRREVPLGRRAVRADAARLGDGEGGRFKQDATWEVGAAPPNGYGLIDIGFNVHEWCSDWYDPGYYAVSPGGRSAGPAEGRAGRASAERKAPRRRVASRREGQPLRRAQQHPAGVPVQRLWIQGCDGGWVGHFVNGQAFCVNKPQFS